MNKARLLQCGSQGVELSYIELTCSKTTQTGRSVSHGGGRDDGVCDGP